MRHSRKKPCAIGTRSHRDRLGIQAIEHYRRKVRFFSTIELVNALEQEKAKGKAGQIAESLTRLDLVILDELGYLPFSASGGALLFHLLSKLYERTSVVIAVVLRMLWKLPISGLLAWDVGSGQAARSRDIDRSD